MSSEDFDTLGISHVQHEGHTDALCYLKLEHVLFERTLVNLWAKFTSFLAPRAGQRTRYAYCITNMRHVLSFINVQNEAEREEQQSKKESG